MLGSVSKAAERLAVTRPTVSRQLASLEKELGARLFTRTSTGLEPTPAGRSFPLRRPRHPHPQGTGRRTGAGGGRGRHFGITAVAPTTTTHYVLCPFLAETGAPLVRHTVPELVYGQVSDETADIAVNPRPLPAELTERRLAEVPLNVQGPPGGPWSGRAERDLRELRGRRTRRLRRTPRGVERRHGLRTPRLAHRTPLTAAAGLLTPARAGRRRRRSGGGRS
ncbi:LysR family transcriptional regulator [Streptomyces sp. AD55]|uniref:LysR family transcriptional regulator n=1 Tax=Streptomyces sp. AD55 TaxID=3242895 RepID=UPI003528E704